ncbi:MAG: hypothetical protein Tsb0020_01300 [Haliangiales bacterium]
MTVHPRLILLTTVMTLSLAFGALSDAQAERRQPLDATQIRQVMAKHMPAVRSCYESHVMAERGATGTVTLELLVRAGGQVAAVDTNLPGVDKKPVKQFSKCVSSQAKRWRFPKSSYQTLVKYPMMFLHTKSNGAGPKPGKGSAAGPRE